MATISRQEYNNLFGPTVGDKIRLGDTDLYVEIEKDLREYGDEVVYGGGKTIRDGMGLANTMTSEEGALDLVITNVTIIDANLGVVKADVGVKDGKIAGIGKAGNPNIMHGVHPDLVTSTATDAISGEHLILTAAGIDGHVHMISPQQAYACLSNGITTLFGGGIGPTDGSNGTTITSGRWNIERMLESIEGLPVNVGLLGKGNCSMNQPLEEQIEAGACGLKIHEDWGSTPAAIRAALGVADRFDVQAAIHSDTLNESGYVEDTIAAMDGRTIHTYHTEGAGGGHAPDLLKVASMPYVLPSSTNPTLPFGVNSQAELFDMIMVCHNLNPKIPSDVAFAESRVRPETQAAENVLHDLGILSMVSSDSQAMGRIGESFMRTFQMASFMKNACDAARQDLTDFFRKTGMLKPIDQELDDYTCARMTITEADCKNLIAYARKYKKPESPVIYYISVNSAEAYKNRLPVRGVYNQGDTEQGNRRIVSHDEWKNAVVFETYKDREMVRITMVGTDSRDNSSTTAPYPEGSTRIEAVSLDGRRTLVYGKRPAK